MGCVSANVRIVLQQTVTVKPDFGKAVFRGLERSGLALIDRVTVAQRPEHRTLADQDAAWLLA